MESNTQVITHRFSGWDTIPDISHLREIENSCVGFIASNITYVSYLLQGSMFW